MVTERHDRGQLILITAIAVAFILLAIVIVFNGLLFTQTIASEDASKATTDVKTSERELEQGIQGIVQRSNLEESSDWETDVESFVSEYRDATGATKPAIVNVSVDSSEGATFHSETISAKEDKQEHIGHFTLEEPNDVDVNITEAGSGITLCDETVDSDGVVDFVTGSNLPSGCEPLNPADEHEISIDLDDDVYYEMVTKDSGGNAAWAVDITYTYDSSGVTYDRTFTVDIYEGVPDHAWPEGDDT
ncbi:DUF7261 family protein [Natronobeatus ordinarius]|uniref:DUF7261 family protein n=1 Tax=Natronobeatus ordinarius TaxID=2963433 RepID=UPI0020CE09E2|nr:hypothetical protein [Natronobeatus ordinarius]